MGISPAFAQLLSDRREDLNQRVAMARTRSLSFDNAAFSAFLETHAGPLVDRVLAENQSAGAASVDAVFDAAVTLVEHRWAGHSARTQTINQLWSDVLPRFASAIATNPKGALGTLSNAAIKLSQEPGARMAQWLEVLASLGRHARTQEDLRHLAVICAWRAGVAHIREAALTAAENLPAVVACAAVGANDESDWGHVAKNFAAQRWWAPSALPQSDGHDIGAFVGFGGQFPEPPMLFTVDDSFVVQSGDRKFYLFADAFGATLRPIDTQNLPDTLRPDRAAGRRLRIDRIQADDRIVPLRVPKQGICIAETSDSIAVSSPYSHSVHVLPRAIP